MSDVAAIHKTPLHGLHLRLGGRMVSFAGYEMPLNFRDGIIKEHLHTRTAAGLFDVSHMGQLRLRPGSGSLPEVAAALERLIPADIVGLPPGWQRGRAQKNSGFSEAPRGGKRDPVTINGKAVDKTGAPRSGFKPGERVFHQKFGYGRVTEVDGNKLTVDFEKAGEKRVVENFVERA